MTKKVALLLADGFEEIEAVVIADVLRRAKIDVTLVGVESALPRGAHAIAIQADRQLQSTDISEPWDAVVLPGGMPGAATLRDHSTVIALIQAQVEHKRWVAAICAAPIALAQAGVVVGRRATCFPGFEASLASAGALIAPAAIAAPADEAPQVIVDHPIITSRGVGTALPFALELVAQVLDRKLAQDLAARMLVVWH